MDRSRLLAAGPPSGRSTSLPPLRKPTVEDVMEAVNLPPKLPRCRLSGRGPKDWTYRCRQGSERGLGLLQGPELPAPGRRSAASSSARTSRSATPQPQEEAASAEPARETRRFRHHPSHFRTLKAVYLGEASAGVGVGAGPEGGGPNTDLMDAIVDAHAHAELNSDRCWRQELAGLRTGEDAITFFTKYSSGTTVKLLHCIRPSHDRPYDLLVVPPDKVQSEYFTISASGVIHFRPGQLSEITPLSEWAHQSMLCRVLSSTIFKFYLHRKCLALWKTTARYKVYCRCRLRLARTSLFAQPVSVKPLVQAHSLIRDVAEVQVLRIPGSCCQLTEFMEMQHEVCSNPTAGAQKRLTQTHDALVGLLEGVVARARSALDTGPQPWQQMTTTGSRSKSMTQEKQDARGRHRHRQLAEEQVAMLGACIRLVDYMLQTTLVSLVWGAASEVRRRVEGAASDPQQKLFLAAVSFGKDAVALTPAREQFMRIFPWLWEELFSVADSLPALVTSRALAPSNTRGWVRQTVKSIFTRDPSWRACVSRIQDSVGRQFSDAHERAQDMYEPYRQILHYGQNWDEARFISQEHTYETLYRQMEIMRRCQEDLSKFRAQKAVGFIFLDAKLLYSSLASVPEAALSVMKQLLTALAREKCLSGYRRLDLACKALADYSGENCLKEPLATFDAFTRTLEAVVAEQDSIDDTVDEVVRIYELLKRYSVRVPLDDQLQRDLLHGRHDDLVHKILPDAKLFAEQQRRQQQSHEQQSAELEEEDSLLVTFHDPLESHVDFNALGTPAATMQLPAALGSAASTVRPHDLLVARRPDGSPDSFVTQEDSVGDPVSP